MHSGREDDSRLSKQGGNLAMGGVETNVSTFRKRETRGGREHDDIQQSRGGCTGRQISRWIEVEINLK